MSQQLAQDQEIARSRAQLMIVWGVGWLVTLQSSATELHRAEKCEAYPGNAAMDLWSLQKDVTVFGVTPL